MKQLLSVMVTVFYYKQRSMIKPEYEMIIILIDLLGCRIFNVPCNFFNEHRRIPVYHLQHVDG